MAVSQVFWRRMPALFFKPAAATAYLSDAAHVQPTFSGAAYDTVSPMSTSRYDSGYTSLFHSFGIMSITPGPLNVVSTVAVLIALQVSCTAYT